MLGNLLTDDLMKILKLEDFAVIVVYKGAMINAIFDNEDVEAQMADGTVRIIPQAVLTARSADFPAIAEGETVAIGSDDFTIRSWMDDGTGMIDIHLEKNQ